MARQHGIKNCPLSGIVATGDGKIEKHTLEYIEVNKIPLSGQNWILMVLSSVSVKSR